MKDLTENKALTEAADAEKKVEQEKEKEKEIAMKEKLCKAAWTQKKAMQMKIRKRKKKKPMREKVERDAEKIEDEAAKNSTVRKKTATDEIVEVSNQTDESRKESSKVADELIEEKKQGLMKSKIHCGESKDGSKDDSDNDEEMMTMINETRNTCLIDAEDDSTDDQEMDDGDRDAEIEKSIVEKPMKVVENGGANNRYEK